MDPTQCYLEMLDAMPNVDLAVARERALALREWLDRGGFYPQTHSRATVHSNLADVLRQTKRNGLSEEDSG